MLAAFPRRRFFMSTSFLTSWLEPPDSIARPRTRREVRAARMRIVVASMGELTVLAAPLSTPYFIYGYAVMILA